MINLWKLYNLFTGANKMSYIDTFLDRGVGCQSFVNGLYGQEELKRKHRQHARFINTVFTATMLGASAADQLESGNTIR